MPDIHEDSLMIVGTKKQGRPHAKQPSTPVMTWVPTDLHARLCQLAGKHGVSVSRMVKNMLILQLHRDNRSRGA